MTVVKPDNTRKIVTTLLFLVLSSLACTQAVITPTPTPTPSPSPQPAATPTAPAPTPRATDEVVRQVTIRAVVYIRAEADPNSDAIGSLETGERVQIVECDGDWCEIDGGGFVFRGCTSDNPDGLLCEARE